MPSNTNTTTYPGTWTCFKCKKTYYNVAQLTNGGIAVAACSKKKGDGCTGKIENA